MGQTKREKKISQETQIHKKKVIKSTIEDFPYTSGKNWKQEITLAQEILLQRLEETKGFLSAEYPLIQDELTLKSLHLSLEKMVKIAGDLYAHAIQDIERKKVDGPFEETIHLIQEACAQIDQVKGIIEQKIVLAKCLSTIKTYKLPEIAPWMREDFIIKSLLSSFEELAKDASKIYTMALCDSENKYKESPEESIKIIKQSVFQLKQHFEKLNHLNANILSRLMVIYNPQQDEVELEQQLNLMKLQFKERLEVFLINFSTIKMAEKNKDDKYYEHVKPLRDETILFFKELHQEMSDDYLSFDQWKTGELRDALFSQIGAKQTFLSFKKPPEMISHAKIESILNGLFFKRSIKPDKEFLQKQLAKFHHLMAMIDAFPLKILKNHDALINLSETQDKLISENFNMLIQETDRLHRELINKTNLFLNPFKYDLKQAHIVQKELELFELELRKVYSSYLQEQEEIADLSCPFNQLKAIAESQHVILDVLDKLKSTNGKNIFDKTNKQIEVLTLDYQSKREQFQIELESEVKQAQGALSVYDTKKDFFPHLLNHYKDIITKLRDDKKEYSLCNLQFEVNQATKELQLGIEKIKVQLKVDLQKAYDDIIERELFYLPRLSFINPFKKDLETTYSKTLEQYTDITCSFAHLTVIQGKDIPTWLVTFSKQIITLNELTDRRDKLSHFGKLVEKRIKSDAYKKSINVLDTLEKEFNRILNKTLDKNSTYPILPQSDDSESIINKISDPKLLNDLDPRLLTLQAMYKDFKTINQQYISRDLQKLNDETYKTALLENVIKHLHNNHMEAISAGKRGKLIQFIRIHILKNIQSLTNQAYHYVKYHNAPNHRFFVTIGACETERKLVNTGNEIYSMLVSPPA